MCWIPSKKILVTGDTKGGVRAWDVVDMEEVSERSELVLRKTRIRILDGVFWTFLERKALRKKMRQAKSATVSNFKSHMMLCVGDMVGVVIRLFLRFFEVSHWHADGVFWTVPEQPPRIKICAWLNPPPCPMLSV